MTNSFNLTLSGKHIICPSILNDSFAGQSNLGCKSLLFITLNNSFLPCLTCKVSFKKSADSLMGTPLQVTVSFSLTSFRIPVSYTHLRAHERILEAAGEKDTITYKGVPIRLSADFSKDTLQARRSWKEIFKVMKGEDIHPRLLYPAKLSFRMEGKIKCFSDKVKLKKFIITKPLLYEMLKGVI